MGATYTRQSTYTEGDVIQAADTNDEFDQLLAAFAASTGHTHDGTTGEGGPISTLAGHGITFGAGTSGTDITITFDGETNDGVLKWMEDEDYFEFSDDILIASTEKIQFRDTAIFINSSTDGQLDIDADTELEITAPTVDINASTAVLISNDLKLDSDAAVLGFGADNDVTLTHVADTGLLLNSTMAIQFNDASQFINAPSATVLDINATDEIELNATLIDINGNVDVSGTLTVAGAVDFGDAALSNVGAVQLDSISGDADTNTSITFSGSDVITITTGGESQITFNNGSILPTTDDDVDLGSSSLQFKDLYIDGTANIDAASIDALTVSGSTTLAATSFGDADITNVGSIALDTITNDGTDITLDSSGDIILDADGANVIFKDAGTSILDISNDSTDAVLTVSTADKNLTIKGTDGSSAITALDIDMALAGKATFNGDVVVGGDLTISGDDLVMATNTSGHLLIADGTNFNPTGVGDLSEISTVANDDVFLAVDTSGGGLKKITRSTIVSGLATSSGISNIVEDTTPQLGGNLDTNSHNILIDDAHFIGDENGNEQIVFQTTSSAVNQIEVTNAATGNGVQIASTGGDTNIDLKLLPKGSGQVVIDGNVGIESGLIDLKNAGAVSKIKFYCESSNAHAQTLQGAPHSEAASNSLTLPSTGGDVDLVSTASTATLTNKTLTAPKIADGGFIADANGNELVVFQTTGSAVNQLEITNNASGSNPILAATGGDTNIGIALTPKGTGEIVIGAGNLNYGGTAVTATGAELNILDGVTSTAAELNILDGVTSTAAELNILDGVTSTAAELNVLDGITAVVGELNALDIGSTAVGTAVASKAVILDSNKDYTGIRNLTISGEIDAATGDFSGAVDVAGALTTAAITASGVLKTDATTEATSTTDGALQTDGGLSVVKDAVFGDDVKLLSDAAVLSFGADADVTVTHVADTGVLLNAAMVVQFRDSAINIGSPADGDLDINADDEIELNSTLIDINGNVEISGTLAQAGVLTANAGVVVDNITIDGTEIDLSSGDLTLDVAGDIILDADGGDVFVKDGGTTFGSLTNTSGNLIIKSGTTTAATFSGANVTFAGTLGSGAITSSGNITAFSDRRLKSDIQTLENGLKKVEQLRGVTYTRDDNIDGGQQLGVIAQEVEEVFPQIVLTADDERGTKSVDYGRLTGVLIEAVKELSAKVKELEGKLDAVTK